MSRNRVCTVPGCPTIYDAADGSRCPTHRTAARRARGTTTEMGLGWEHQQHRRQLIANAIGTPCPDCGAPMTDPHHMVADHTTPRSHGQATVADRVHCRRCSNKQGGQLAHANNR